MALLGGCSSWMSSILAAITIAVTLIGCWSVAYNGIVTATSTSTTTSTPTAATDDGDASDPTAPVTSTLELIHSSSYSNASYDTSTNVYTGNVRALRLTVNFTEQLNATTDTTVKLFISLGSRQTFALRKILKKLSGNSLVFREYLEHEYDTEKVSSYNGVEYILDHVKDAATSKGIEGGDLGFTVEYEIVCVAQNVFVEELDGVIVTAVEITTGDYSIVHTVTFDFKGEPKPTRFDFTLDKPNEIELLQALEVQLTVTLACAVSYLEVEADAYLDLNNTTYTDGLMLQTLHVNSVGQAYDYVVHPLNLQSVGNDTCPPKPSLILSSGPWIKGDPLIRDKETNDYNSSASITMSVVLVVTDPTLVGSEVTLTLFVAEPATHSCPDNKTRIKLLLKVLPQSSETTQEGLELVTSDEDHISPGVKRLVELKLTTSEARNATYEIDIDTRPETSYYAGSLKMLGVSSNVSHGSNILCPTLSLTDKTPTIKTSNKKKSYTVSVVACNVGVDADPAANLLTFEVVVLLTGLATKGQRYYMETRLHNTTVDTAFVVDSPSKETFWLELANIYESELSGRHSFVILTIATPPGTSKQYSIVIRKDSSEDLLPNTAILTVNVKRVGSNVQGITETSVLAVHLESSLNSSTTDVARVTSWLTNNATVDEPGANELELEVVVVTSSKMADFGVKTHNTLEVSLNDLGSKQIDIKTFVGPIVSFDPLDGNLKLFTSCPSGAFFPGMIAGFAVEVTTRTDTTTGPLVIVVKPNPRYTFDKASVESRGRNVVCVKSGSIEPSEATGIKYRYAGETALTIPLLCNRKRSTKSTDNKMKVEIFVRLTSSDMLLVDEQEDVFTVAVVSNDELIGEFDQSFTVATLRDLGSLQVVKSFNVPEVHTLMTYSYNVLVLWSGDAETVHCRHSYNSLRSKVPGGYWTHIPSNPIVARYIGLSYYQYRKTGCSIDIGGLKTTSDDVPIVRGPRDQTESMSRNIGLLLQWWHESIGCPASHELQTFERTQYIWADFRLSMFNLESQLTPFTVYLYGRGLKCNAKTGKQITMVAHPQSGKGNQHRMCDLRSEGQHYPKDSDTYQYCSFVCNCTTGRTECSKFTLLAVQTGSEGNFSLTRLAVGKYYS